MAGSDDIYKILRRSYQSQFGSSMGPKALVAAGSVTPDSGAYFSTVTIVSANTRVSTITINGTAINSFASVDLPSGFCFYGQITSVTLTAGSAICYQTQLNEEGLNG